MVRQKEKKIFEKRRGHPWPKTLYTLYTITI